jgi:predicted ATP-grasp superfamily ATP-dependent carboligase
MMTHRRHLPVAVVAGGDINGLGVVRSLARGNVPVLVLDTDLSSSTLRTRFARKRVIRSLEGEQFVAALIELRLEFAEEPVLFLTQERSVAAVAGNLDRVSKSYRISMPANPVMEMLMDKARFQTVAETHGFPVPRAVVLRNPSDLEGARSLQFPCVLKPVVKSPCYDQRFKKAYVVETIDQVKCIFEEIKNYAEMIVQEWIEGGDDAIYFCLQFRSRDQIPLASFAGRKIRSWPPRVGGTASCMPAPEHAPELHRLTDQFFSKAGFFGLGAMEYKRDSETGRLMMVEPTVGRTDLQEEVATLNGVNIPLAAYAYEIGEPIPQPAPPRRAAAWVVSQIDRWSAELQHVACDFPRDLRRFDAVARLNDPLPGLYSAVERISARLTLRRQ